jgi:hypothetical protein
MAISTSVRRLAAMGGLLATLAGGSVLVAGAASASPTTDAASVTPVRQSAPATATPTAVTAAATRAPDCIHVTSYPHGQHTNVYLDNNCSSQKRVKVIMRDGYDSACTSLNKGSQNTEFSLYSDDYLTPSVNEVILC